nr:PREDICTED: replication protein A 14 kDa subunit-like [Megachile rotundata]XP_012151276.1 PREDICTED: replication protein A 14 kDa subunit-like [Megachile rotundata]
MLMKMMKNRIDGHRLAQNVGELVILLGTVGKKSSNGKNIELKTTDGVAVNVTLPEPIDSNVEGYIEVHGTLNSKSTMACSSYILFPSSMTEDFDSDHYNEALSLLNVLGPRKWKISEDDTGL